VNSYMHPANPYNVKINIFKPQRFIKSCVSYTFCIYRHVPVPLLSNPCRRSEISPILVPISHKGVADLWKLMVLPPSSSSPLESSATSLSSCPSPSFSSNNVLPPSRSFANSFSSVSYQSRHRSLLRLQNHLQIPSHFRIFHHRRHSLGRRDRSHRWPSDFTYGRLAMHDPCQRLLLNALLLRRNTVLARVRPRLPNYQGQSPPFTLPTPKHALPLRRVSYQLR
jgi:hypothetical protein